MTGACISLWCVPEIDHCLVLLLALRKCQDISVRMVRLAAFPFFFMEALEDSYRSSRFQPVFQPAYPYAFHIQPTILPNKKSKPIVRYLMFVEGTYVPYPKAQHIPTTGPTYPSPKTSKRQHSASYALISYSVIPILPYHKHFQLRDVHPSHTLLYY